MVVNIRILQVTMLRAKFSRINIRAYLLQRCDNNFGSFDNKFCTKFTHSKITEPKMNRFRKRDRQKEMSKGQMLTEKNISNDQNELR